MLFVRNRLGFVLIARRQRFVRQAIGYREGGSVPAQNECSLSPLGLDTSGIYRFFASAVPFLLIFNILLDCLLRDRTDRFDLTFDDVIIDLVNICSIMIVIFLFI